VQLVCALLVDHTAWSFIKQFVERQNVVGLIQRQFDRQSVP
jgi:hypothetical protein